MSEANISKAQAAQNAFELQIIVDGNPNWRPLLDESTKLNGDFWIELCGGTEVPLLHYLKKESELNRVSFERSVLSTFLDKGFVLEELEIEFSDPDGKKWGACSWYKEHSIYEKPIKGFEGMHPKWTPFMRSMCKTEHAGDQEFSLFSMQMFGAALVGMPVHVLLHKTLLFKKAVFSSPKKEAQAA